MVTHCAKTILSDDKKSTFSTIALRHWGAMIFNMRFFNLTKGIIAAMYRYQRLIRATLNPCDDQPKVRLSDLAKKLGMPITTLYNYVHFDTFPHAAAAVKIAEYYGESLSGLFSEDDDLTVQLVARVRQLSDLEKAQLLESL